MKIKHNAKGYRELLKHPSVLADVRRRARAISDAAGEGFEAQSSEPHTRARAAVVTVTFQARRKNSAENTLVRSLDAGR